MATQVLDPLLASQDEKLPQYRLIIVLESDRYLTHAYREHIQAWLYKECLANPIGRDMHNSVYPCYTFALVPQAPYKTEKGIKSTDGCWLLHISSAYIQMLNSVEEWIEKHSDAVSWAGTPFTISGLYRYPVINNVQCFANPILIIGKDNNFIAPSEPGFNSAVERSLALRYKFRTGQEPGDIKFSFIGTPRQRLIQYKNRNLLSFEGAIRLISQPEVTRFAQMSGLGQKPGAGFGALL